MSFKALFHICLLKITKVEPHEILSRQNYKIKYPQIDKVQPLQCSQTVGTLTYERWSFRRGSDCKDLNEKILVFCWDRW